MKHRLYGLRERSLGWYYIGPVVLLVLLLVVMVFVMPASAAMRFQDRSLYMNSTAPGEDTFYRVSFSYMSPDSVGSVDMLFCIDPIPHHPCVTPPGLDVSEAILSQQLGEVGFSITERSDNHLVLSRTPTVITDNASAYTFENITNPDDPQQAFAIRLRSHASVDASGPQIDFGSIRGQVTEGIEIATQVPPMLIFCMAQEVSEHCTDSNEVYYHDMGELSPRTTLTAQSQMAVGTNATGGFAITAVGPPVSAGNSVIKSATAPVASRVGTNQFGINLVANNTPDVGRDPEGSWTNAVVSPDYNLPNQYKYVSGDVVAYSPNVSLMKKFTVSYILNSDENLKAGVYTTTITFVASGRF